MSTVDPYTTHHRDETERLDGMLPGDLFPGDQSSDDVIDLSDGHSYTYPSALVAEGVGEPLDLHPYEEYEDVEPRDRVAPSPERPDRPAVPGPDATTWPPRTPFPDEQAAVDPRASDSGSWIASTRGLGAEASRFLHRLETSETKVFYKTSEFAVTVVASLILMIAALASSTFDADQLWPSFTWLVGFYLVSRGLAKAGSRAD